jgi:hypothetical protein
VLRARRWLAAAGAGLAGVGAGLGAGACGGGDKIPATFTTSIPGPTSVVRTPSTAATASTASATTATGTTTGGAGTTTARGQRGARVPAIFSLKAGKLTPPTVSVPAFLAAQVTVTSTDPRPHTVVVKLRNGYTFQVPARGSGTVKVPGQKAGKVQVLVDGKPAGTLSWGGEPGP